MEPLVLDSNFQVTGVVDMFTSFIWTERYSAQGDFELELPIASGALSFINTDSYLYLPLSNRLMLIDTVKIHSDVESGTNVLVSGISLESILSRRVAWIFYAKNGNLQTVVKEILDRDFIDPDEDDRKVSNLSFTTSVDPAVTALDVEVQLLGENLYETVKSICDTVDLGFRITMVTLGSWEFELYAGKDRSYNQVQNPYVVFSPGFENLLSSNYVTSKQLMKTCAYIGGEGEGAAKVIAWISQPDGEYLSGLNRREIFVDASGVSSQSGVIPEEEYYLQLEQKGKEALAEASEFSIFDGEAAVGDMYEYGRDYYLGDIVQITNEYGFSSRSRVVEFIRSEDETGIKSYPTFAAV